MTKERLLDIFKHIEFIEIDEFMITRNKEIYNLETDSPIDFTDWNQLLEHKIHGQSIRDALDQIEFEFHYEGGRGSSSGSGEMGGGFNHASQRGRKAENYGKIEYPAVFNTQGRFATQDEAIRLFNDRYKDSDIEYGISVDENGFVHRHIRGSATSVPISAYGKNHIVVHNHPSGGAFSDTDLIAAAQDTHATGIVATAGKVSHVFRKGPDFKAVDFARAVKKAKWPKDLTYDAGVKWWMKKNAKDYGFTYEVRKTKKAAR
ncbi:hypothetical protein DSECCO2_568490 [anaerobic digester metagenome]